jgi:hypothetical protein
MTHSEGSRDYRRRFAMQLASTPTTSIDDHDQRAVQRLGALRATDS